MDEESKEFIDLPSPPKTRAMSITRMQTSKFQRDRDISSLSNHLEVATESYHLDWFVDFQNKEIRGKITLKMTVLTMMPIKTVVLDNSNLLIERALNNGSELKFQNIVIEGKQALGKALTIYLEKQYDTDEGFELEIYYKTTSDTTALSWLEPEMTFGKKQPFLFSQCEMINCRSLAPLQDTPWIKSYYTARVQCPKDLTVIMSGIRNQEKSKPAEGIFYFEQNIMKLPSYLLAIACGDLKRQALDERCGVISEPSFLQKSVNELVDLPKFLKAAEDYLDIPYNLPQYNVVVLPPAFPFGGMENPVITFATPSIIVGDKSQVNVAAHEIAHSWTGNWVTNRTWFDFWLNEGFTVFLERKIIKAVFGQEQAFNQAFSGQGSLKQLINSLIGSDKLRDTSLTLPIREGENPDDYFSIIPYEKGFLFLSVIEREVGQDKFREFLHDYLMARGNKTTTLDIMKDELELDFPELFETIDFNLWTTGLGKTPVDGQSLFETEKMREISSLSKEQVQSKKTLEEINKSPSIIKVAFIQHVASLGLSDKEIKKIDEACNFSGGANPEAKVNWLPLGFKTQDKAYLSTIEKNAQDFLSSIGRGKYVFPTFTAYTNALPDNCWRFYLMVKDSYYPTVQKQVAQIIQRPSQKNKTVREHQIGSARVVVAHGDITNEFVDCVVNAANGHLAHGAGVAGAISSKGGPAIQDESNKYVNKHGEIPTGSACYTGAGRLPCRYVIHAVGPVYHRSTCNEADLLKSCVLESLALANKLGSKSISIPAISSGIFGFPKPFCGYIMLDTVVQYLNEEEGKTSLKEIRLVNFDAPTVQIFTSCFDDMFGARYSFSY